jgi:hypothetical protein
MPTLNRSWRRAAVLLVVCLVPAPALAQIPGEPPPSLRVPPPSLRVPTIAASAAAAADWATTYHALKHFHVRETNPLLRPLDGSPGSLISVGAVIDAAAFSTWNVTVGRKHPKAAAAGLWAMAAFRTYLAIHNVRNMQKAARRER